MLHFALVTFKRHQNRWHKRNARQKIGRWREAVSKSEPISETVFLLANSTALNLPASITFLLCGQLNLLHFMPFGNIGVSWPGRAGSIEP